MTQRTIELTPNNPYISIFLSQVNYQSIYYVGTSNRPAGHCSYLDEAFQSIYAVLTIHRVKKAPYVCRYLECQLIINQHYA